jgi:hypothetical protein
MSRRLALFSCLVSFLFVLGASHPLWHFETLEEPDLISPTDSRNAVHEGEWAAYKQTPVKTYCEHGFAYDNENDFIAIPECSDYNQYTIDITIRQNSDWSTIIHTIETNLDDLIFFQFSPNGKYFLALEANIEIFRTSDWTQVFSGDMYETDGSYYPAYDVSWSGDGERLVISNGNNGGKMYEGPDWTEVTGTTSNGYYVAHHPTEDTLWYMTREGAISEYELQDVPLVGKSWVQVQTYNAQYDQVGPMTISSDGEWIAVHTIYDSIVVFSTSSFDVELTTDGLFPVFSSTNTHLLFQTNSGYEIYSSQWWSKTSGINESPGSRYYPSHSFSSNDDEIITFNDGRYYGDFSLTGIKPDSDKDGVVDDVDQCNGTPDDENSDINGCAPSQKDSDLDGVNDRDDNCPRTSLGASVDISGCSDAQLLDSDDDGVSDSDDQCPNTPLDEYGNIHGCSSSQRDVDGDGFSDLNDVCPLHDIEECSNVITWEPNTEPVASTEDYSPPVWSPIGDLFATFEDSNTIHILDTDFSIEYEIINQIEDTYFSLMSWLPGGDSFVVLWSNYSYYDSTCGYSVYVLSDIENPTHHTISYWCDYFSSHAIDPAGNKLAVSIFSYYDYSGKLITVDIDTGIQEFENEEYYPQQLEYSHDGTTLIGSSSGEILFWDTSDGYLLRSKNLDSISSFHQSPDGDWLIVSTNDEIKLYSFNTLIFKDAISVERNTTEDFYTSLGGLSLSRNGDLIYASIYETHYTSDVIYRNVTLHTYLITESTELEFLAQSSPVNKSRWMITSISPDESMAIVSINSIDGFTVWAKDSDGDGLIDSIDECPDTSLDFEVNDKGCGGDQLDDDGDGLANFEDLCPDSPGGIATDQNGCTDQQVDEDFDGICNQDAPSDGPSNCVGRDQCPGSLSGIIIDSNGCGWAQQDSDGDGVVNIDDLCEDTEIAGDADENGCDRKQRDSDLDSVKDYWDDCEFTPVGDITDDAGCSDVQVDSDSDSICNRGAVSYGPSNCTSVDTCPNTEANETVDENGCSWNQQDEDGDGIFNKFDQCPGTLDESVALNGCSTWQADADGDGVNDANDECANTDSNQIADSKGCSKDQNELIDASSGDESLATNTVLGIAGLIFFVLTILFVLRRQSSDFVKENPLIEYPDYATRGAMRDGMEWIEHPSGSQQWFYRDPSTQQWVHRK